MNKYLHPEGPLKRLVKFLLAHNLTSTLTERFTVNQQWYSEGRVGYQIGSGNTVLNVWGSGEDSTGANGALDLRY